MFVWLQSQWRISLYKHIYDLIKYISVCKPNVEINNDISWSICLLFANKLVRTFRDHEMRLQTHTRNNSEMK